MFPLRDKSRIFMTITIILKIILKPYFNYVTYPENPMVILFIEEEYFFSFVGD